MSTAAQPERLSHPMVFINLVVEDVKKAIAFYRALGWHENEIFRDETSASMEVSDNIVVMLLENSKFSQFNDRDSYTPGARARSSTASSSPRKRTSTRSCRECATPEERSPANQKPRGRCTVPLSTTSTGTAGN